MDPLSEMGLLFGALCLALVGISAFHNRESIRIFIKTFPRDIRGLIRFIKTFSTLKRLERSNMTVGKIFHEIVQKHPQKICFYFEEEEWTFEQVEELSNAVANYFLRLGYKKGGSIALFMENRPEYVAIWLGLSKIGIVIPLINSNLRHDSLRHSLTVANSKVIIFSTQLSSALEEVVSLQIPQTVFCSLGPSQMSTNSIDLTKELKNEPKTIPVAAELVNFNDSLFYIYTSGTTGMPKAAVIRHSRFAMGSISFHFMNALTSSDVVYTSLPLYHTAGGLCGIGQALFFGNSVVIRKKFSAKNFWSDCIKYNVTVAQYIGEICRYLLAQPEDSDETNHKVRVMVGNGLRSQIWNEFRRRFKIQQISEIYGSTDGNCNMVNFDNKVGAVGFVPPLLRNLYPMTLIRINEETGDPIRDWKSGLVIKCSPNEAGELVGKIVKDHPIRDFQGYAENSEAGTASNSTNTKIVASVFNKGDTAFRSGDLLVMDKYGYFYFKDRTGDTFRWKGENVSTTEIESVISSVCELKDAVVYGVEIPGTEGKAGMVALSNSESSIDLEKFYRDISKALPVYAIPLFVRIIAGQLDVTGTLI